MTGTDVRWKDDWNVFIDVLQQLLQSGATQKDLADCFGGCEVRWTGTIEQIDFDELVAVVDVSLPERFVTLQDGSEVRLDGLTLAVAEGAKDKWQLRSPGDEVTFIAILGEPNSPFSTLELKTLKSGKSIIMIRASNALPA